MSAVPAGAELSWDGAMRLLEALPAMPLGERGAQVELLVHNSSPGIRERVLHLGANLLPEERIAEHLRNDHDAVLRNAGLEMLKLRGARSFQLAVRLLADPEPDVVLQAVLLLDHLRDPRALEPLRAVLGHGDLNVAQAAILAIGRLGDGRSIPDLLPFLDADPWLQMAAVQALGDLRSRRAAAALARMLTDPVIGAIAAEALARIGGATACRALAAHWLGQAGPLDDAALLGLLAHTLEGLSRSRAALADQPLADRPALDQLLRSLGGRLADPAPEIRAAAARCVLALGPSAGDEAALAALIALGGPPPSLRRCDGPARPAPGACGSRRSSRAASPPPTSSALSPRRARRRAPRRLSAPPCAASPACRPPRHRPAWGRRCSASTSSCLPSSGRS
jgi:HEAT repeat protein